MAATPQPDPIVSARANLRTALDIVATVAMVIAAAALVWSAILPKTPVPAGRPPIPVPKEPLSLEDVPILGRPDATIAIVEFSDFECPYCGRFVRDTLPELKERYIDTGQVLLAFRHLPLPIHTHAQRAAETAECARRQGRFWQMHDALFAQPTKLDEPDFITDGERAGLDASTFASCLDGQAVTKVQTDLKVARSLSLTGTPTFVVGKRDGHVVRTTGIIVGAEDIAGFAASIHALLE